MATTMPTTMPTIVSAIGMMLGTMVVVMVGVIIGAMVAIVEPVIGILLDAAIIAYTQCEYNVDGTPHCDPGPNSRLRKQTENGSPPSKRPESPRIVPRRSRPPFPLYQLTTKIRLRRFWSL